MSHTVPEHALIGRVVAQQVIHELQAVLHHDAAVRTALFPASTKDC